MPDVPADPSLAIIVVNFGSSPLLASNLAIVASAVPEALVVVVDNRSTDRERMSVEALCLEHGWVGVFPATNTGFGGGCNVGADVALGRGAQSLLLLNPDATIDADSVRLLSAAIERDPLTLAGPRVVTPDGTVWSAGVDLDLERGDMRSWRRREEAPHARTMPWLSGACLMLSATLWRELGGFDEDYFLYWEDVDLSVRVVAAGGRLELVDGATAVHDEGQTHVDAGRPEAKSSLYYYYNIRNRLLFADKHLSPEDRRRWRRTSVGAARQILLRGGRRQFARPIAPVGAAWRGLRDGWRQSRG